MYKSTIGMVTTTKPTNNAPPGARSAGGARTEGETMDERNTMTQLHTSLDRAELFAWQERITEEYAGWRVVAVDTWTIEQPTPSGETFTLYAMTLAFQRRP